MSTAHQPCKTEILCHDPYFIGGQVFQKKIVIRGERGISPEALALKDSRNIIVCKEILVVCRQ